MCVYQGVIHVQSVGLGVLRGWVEGERQKRQSLATGCLNNCIARVHAILPYVPEGTQEGYPDSVA